MPATQEALTEIKQKNSLTTMFGYRHPRQMTMILTLVLWNSTEFPSVVKLYLFIIVSI